MFRLFYGAQIGFVVKPLIWSCFFLVLEVSLACCLTLNPLLRDQRFTFTKNSVFKFSIKEISSFHRKFRLIWDCSILEV